MRSAEFTLPDRRWFQFLICWTFVAGGMAPVLPRLLDLPILRDIPYLNFLLFFPAAVLGGLAYLAAPKTLRAGPMLVIIAVMVVGLAWTYPTERGRGLVEIALVATPLPLSVLIRRRREWLVAVYAYLVASAAAAVYLFFDWLGQAERTGLDTFRYGGLYDDHLKRIMEPNITATHLGFGVLLIATLWAIPTRGDSERRWRIICTLCLPVLVTGLILSGSRGAVLSLLGALVVLATILSHRRSLPIRTRLLGGIGLVAIAVLLLATPNPVSNRVGSPNDSVSGNATAVTEARVVSGKDADPSDVTSGSSTRNLGGRIVIWRAALEASGSSLKMTLVGAGTGGADHAVAAANPHLAIAKVGEHGVLRANPHSTYLYWLVSFGTVGLCVAAVAIAAMGYYAFVTDWQLSLGAGTAMMVFFLLTSVTLIASRLEITSIAISSLALGYILPPLQRETAAPGSTLEASQPAGW